MKRVKIKLPPEIPSLTIPAALLDSDQYPDLSMMAILLYAYMKALPKEIDQHGQEYVAFPVEVAKRVFGCKNTTVTISFSALKRYGLLSSYRAEFGGTNRYIIKEVGLCSEKPLSQK